MGHIFEDIDIKKIVCKAVAGILIISVTFFWTGTRKNAYAISVEGKVVAVVKDKEEAERALEKLVKQIKYEKRTDIAINETVVIEPINAKSINIDKEQDVIQALNAQISYNLEAFEILVDGQSKAIVGSKAIAIDVLEEVAKAQFKATDIEIKMEDERADLVSVSQEKPTSTTEAQTALATEMNITTQETNVTTQNSAVTEIKSSIIPIGTTLFAKERVSESVAEVSKINEIDSMQQTNMLTDTEQTKKEEKEILLVKEALPKEEERTKVKVEALKTDDQAKKEDKLAKEVKQSNLEANKLSNEQEDNEEVDASEDIEDVEDVEDVSEEYEVTKEGQKIIRELKNVDFNEEIIIKNAYVRAEDIVSKQDAINILLAYNEEIVEYELEEGDNIWDIAIEHGTTMDHILEINPQIVDETRMQIGEKIKLEVPDPIISISTSEQATFKELIPAEIEYVADEDMYTDETEVQEEGYDGLKEITVIVHKVNGKEVGRDLITQKILKEPKTKVYTYGTKEREISYSRGYSGKPGRSIKPSSSIGFMHPLGGAGSFSSGYGTRWGSFHAGIDIAAPAGTPIYAAASGTVTFSGYNSGGYGNLIIIDHGNGQETYYAHNSSNYVQVGQNVSKGQNIGGVGSTGNSTGNHVHFEIRNYGSPINPYSYVY